MKSGKQFVSRKENAQEEKQCCLTLHRNRGNRAGSYFGRGIPDENEHGSSAEYEPAICNCRDFICGGKPGTGRERGNAADRGGYGKHLQHQEYQFHVLEQYVNGGVGI